VTERPAEQEKAAVHVSDKVCHVMKDELSFFPFMENEDLTDIPCYFEPLQVEAGDVVVREGDRCDFVAFIVSGKLEIKKETEFQGKEFVLGLYGKGSLVGELCFLDDTPRPYSAIALEDSFLVKLPREKYLLMEKESPALALKFLKGLLLASSIRLRKSFDRMASIF